MSTRLLLNLRAHHARAPDHTWPGAEIAGGRLPVGRPQAAASSPSGPGA